MGVGPEGSGGTWRSGRARTSGFSAVIARVTKAVRPHLVLLGATLLAGHREKGGGCP